MLSDDGGRKNAVVRCKVSIWGSLGEGERRDGEWREEMSSISVPLARKNWLLPERAETVDSGGDGAAADLRLLSSCWPSA
jgi:hypothetical protein